MVGEIMKNKNNTSSGQALVIIALAMMALVGIVGLALDGGNTYADRRQAQNAADSSALAAARAYSYNLALSDNDIRAIVLNSTTPNGFNSVSPRSTITVTKTVSSTACDAYTNGYFIQVDITSIVPTYFAKAMGVNNLTNKVSAKALACPPHPAPIAQGNALVALNETICQATKITGNATTIVTSTTNSGMWVNSGCNEGTQSSKVALSAGGSADMTIPAVSVVGGVYGPEIFAPTVVQTGVPQIDKESLQWPTFPCTGQVTLAGTVKIGGVDYKNYTPGVYPGSNKEWKKKVFPPEDYAFFSPGVYCIDEDFSILAHDSMKGTGVTFVSRQGNVVFRGGDGVNLTAPTDTNNPYKGLLIFVTEANTAGDLTINGNAKLNVTGSIFAPWNDITVNGTGDVSAPINAQIIGDKLFFTGNGTINIAYNGDSQFMISQSGQLQLYK